MQGSLLIVVKAKSMFFFAGVLIPAKVQDAQVPVGQVWDSPLGAGFVAERKALREAKQAAACVRSARSEEWGPFFVF